MLTQEYVITLQQYGPPSNELTQFLSCPSISTLQKPIIFPEIGIVFCSLSQTKLSQLSSSASNEIISIEIAQSSSHPNNDINRNIGSLSDKIRSKFHETRSDIDRNFKKRISATKSTYQAQSRYRACPPPSPETSLSWPLKMLGIDSLPHLTGKDIGISIIDTGIDTEHPDFKHRVAEQDRMSFGHPDPMDWKGHGTHCAGIAIGTADPTSNLRTGVAPDARILSANVFGITSNPSRINLIKSMLWSAKRGAKILSMSLGTEREKEVCYPIYMDKVIQFLKDQGILCIIATGNGSNRSQSELAPVQDLASCPSAISVAAIDQSATISQFSNAEVDQYGSVSLSAPGVSIPSTFRRNDYQVHDGTSMACPHIAGLAALLWERFPDANAYDIESLLLKSCIPLGPSSDYGAGLPKITSITA